MGRSVASSKGRTMGGSSSECIVNGEDRYETPEEYPPAADKDDDTGIKDDKGEEKKAKNNNVGASVESRAALQGHHPSRL